MSSLIGTYANGSAVLEALHQFLIVGHTLRPQYSGIGNGYTDDIVGTANSVYETITVTLTSATSFTVAGSASGAMGTGTVGTLFTHDRVKFTLVQGTTNFASGDSMVIQMTPPWSILAYSAGQSYYYSAPGDDGNQNVNVGWSVKSNVTGGYFNARIGAYPTWFSQTSQWKKLDCVHWPLGPYVGAPVKLWATVTGQYIYAVARIGTVYTSMCVGYFDSVHTYDQYPAPYCLGGSMTFDSEPADTSTAWAYNTGVVNSPLFSNAVANSSNTIWGGGKSTFFLRFFNNTWMPSARIGYDYSTSYAVAYIRPSEVADDTHATDWRNCCRNLDDSFPLYPVHLTFDYVDGGLCRKFNLGYMPKVFKIPVYDKSGLICSSESTFRDANTRINYVVVNQGTNVGYTCSYYALELI